MPYRYLASGLVSDGHTCYYSVMSDTASKKSERRITPNRFFIALLVMVLLVVLCGRYEWLGLLRGSGYNVLLAMGIVCAGVFIALVRFLVSLRSGKRIQYGIVSLLLLAVIVAIPCYWFPIRAREARRQEKAVKGIEEAGGKVHRRTANIPRNGLFEKLFGQDFLFRAESVRFDDRLASDVGLVHLGGLAYLRSLDLSNIQITDAGLVHIKGLSSLQNLYLASTQVTDAGLAGLKGLTNLQCLSLDSTQITDAGLVHLESLTHLRGLQTHSTKVTADGAGKLRQVLPKCNISGLPR
jgi:hypothetical protein